MLDLYIPFGAIFMISESFGKGGGVEKFPEKSTDDDAY